MAPKNDLNPMLWCLYNTCSALLGILVADIPQLLMLQDYDRIQESCTVTAECSRAVSGDLANQEPKNPPDIAIVLTCMYVYIYYIISMIYVAERVH